MSLGSHKLIQQYDILSKDIVIIVGHSKKSLNQTKRRSLVRAVFALIEVDIFNKKQICLYRHNHNLYHFSNAELALLNEEQYDIDSKGDVKINNKNIKLTDNLRFTIKSICKATSIKYDLNIGTKDWENFQIAIKIRNRITHPKSPESLFISDEELRTVGSTVKWFTKITSDLNQLLM